MHDIACLQNLVNLKSLSLSGIDGGTLGALVFLQGLESLTISNFYGELSNTEVFSSLSNMKNLTICGATIYSNLEAIFSMPQIEKINMNDCSLGLDFEVIQENQSLKELYMSRIQLLENISVVSDGFISSIYYDEVSFMDEIGFLSKFPNLERLQVQGNKLVDVNFAENLPNLKYLDITNNYVTDLRPLANLQQLDTVWCGENAISQGTDLGEEVNVILDSVGDRGKWGR